MADFDELRDQLRRAREARDSAARELAAAREQLKRIAALETALDRVFNARNPQHVETRNRLREDKASAQARAKRTQEARAAELAAEARVLDGFSAFTDPRDGIAHLNDLTPILLMPVRLETRFKQVGVPDGPTAAASELWLRIYPDDCWIDSFDPALTETEVRNAKVYWTALWQAGGIADQERGAWRGLAGSHGSGRAAWTVSQFQPLNLAQKPVKPRPEDVILTVPTDTALPAGEEIAALDYWRAAWLADGDATKAAAAFTALGDTVGDARAAEIVAQHRPANFDTKLAAGTSRTEVNLGAAFVVFPSVDTKQSAWASAPRMDILPDRFVFIGYRAAEEPLVVLGKPVPSPLIVGPDPAAPKDEQLQLDADGDLVVPEELRWMSDFDRAVEVGMGMRIPLSETQAGGGFDRVLVIGLRLNADEQAAKAELEALLRHHACSRTGLGVLPQGTPTNNTEQAGAGHGRLDDPDQTFDDRTASLFTPQSDWLEKRDGQWVAEYLGIDPALFANVHGADSQDQRIERAMHVALWPATLGYWMETMMAPVFDRETIEQTREFFRRYVLGAGAVPAIRIGAQPYGILPATALSRMTWIEQREPDGGIVIARGADPMRAYLRRLYPILRAVEQDWRERFTDISYTGRAGDPHQVLLDILGLHSGSVEWSQRYAESLKTVFNRLKLQGLAGIFEALGIAAQFANARALLTGFGYTGDQTPQMLEKLFSGKHNLLKGGVVDDTPLSETAPIRAYLSSGQNYIQWLIDAANASLDALYAQDGFIDDKPPAALLYLLLRHALQLGYHDVSVRLHESVGLYTAQAAVLARSDDPFLHIRESAAVSESRYQPLYALQPQITGNSAQTVSQFIAQRMKTIPFAFALREQLDALERLKFQPTAVLERAFADHVDCCSYRLDAWLLGLVNYQLAAMRNIRDRQDAQARQGVYLGAYGWLEELRPEKKQLTPVRLADDDLAKVFGGVGDPPLLRDDSNEGYVHAPSLNQAVAAAVLRNGFISNASPENRQTMAVNLTSERVRVALALLEGIRAGQGLADLLGYQFERGLHDRHNLAEVDKFIFKLRKTFPLRADRMASTKTEEGVSIEAIEARNVIDGLALVEHLKASGDAHYPFGKAGLPDATANEAGAIDAEAARLLESHDAVADLALAEGVYQAVLGNYDRVASTYDAYARGNFPPEPDIVRTPLNGIGLTHRVGLHLAAGTSHTVSPSPGVTMTPRAQAEPALNLWLAKMLPALEKVACRVAFREAASGADAVKEIMLDKLDLQPTDLIALIRDDPGQAMTELDDRIVRFVVDNFGPRPAEPILIRYMEKAAAPYSVFEVMPLVRNLRRLASRSRPLRATDLKLMNEARSDQDDALAFDKPRLDVVQAGLQSLRNDLAVFQAKLEGPLADLDHLRDEILANVDSYIAELVALLARAATFVMPQAGWGFAYDFKQRVYNAILRQFAERATAWSDRLDEFDGLLLAEQALSGTATDQERFEVLIEAERAISTEATAPLPATPALFRANVLNAKRVAFANKLADFATVRNATQTAISLLLAHVQTLLPVSDFDRDELTLTAHEDEIVRFTEDALSVVRVIVAECDRRLKATKQLFLDYTATAAAADKVRMLENAAKAMLGEDFRIFPEFRLDAAQAAELANAFASSQSGDLFKFLEAPPDPAQPALDFPVDAWLYGVARVRETMRCWEQSIIMAGCLGVAEPDLVAMQLPFIPGDRWLALEYPPELKLDTDRLLYTAHFAAAFDPTQSQCGLLLDEWTETIPGDAADTGITFHHDRPNCEAPQTMLLVTPSEFRGRWQWGDLVDALNETLDFAKRRAIEPRHIDASPYAPFLPATIMATQVAQLTIAADLALNNRVTLALRS